MSFTIPGFELALWWFFLVYLAGAIASFGSRCTGACDYYKSLCLPWWAAPCWLFGLMWFILYGIMAYASYRIRTFGPWLSGVNLVELILFCVLLLVTTLWTWMFFRWRWMLLSFINILVSLGLSIAVLILYWRIDSVAGALFIAPTVWLLYATLLMGVIWWKNRMPSGVAMTTTHSTSTMPLYNQGYHGNQSFLPMTNMYSTTTFGSQYSNDTPAVYASSAQQYQRSFIIPAETPRKLDAFSEAF